VEVEKEVARDKIAHSFRTKRKSSVTGTVAKAGPAAVSAVVAEGSLVGQSNVEAKAEPMTLSTSLPSNTSRALDPQSTERTEPNTKTAEPKEEILYGEELPLNRLNLFWKQHRH